MLCWFGNWVGWLPALGDSIGVLDLGLDLHAVVSWVVLVTPLAPKVLFGAMFSDVPLYSTAVAVPFSVAIPSMVIITVV